MGYFCASYKLGLKKQEQNNNKTNKNMKATDFGGKKQQQFNHYFIFSPLLSSVFWPPFLCDGVGVRKRADEESGDGRKYFFHK